MAYDYRALLEKAHSILSATATVSDLVSSMTVDYPIASENIHNRVVIGDPQKIPGYATEYPRINFELIGKDEDFSNLGTRSIGAGTTDIRRDVTTSIFVYAFVYKQDGSDSSDKEAQLLSRNIETIFRTNTQVQGADGWDSCIFPRVQFADAYIEDGDGIYLSAVRLEGEFKKFSIN